MAPRTFFNLLRVPKKGLETLLYRLIPLEFGLNFLKKREIDVAYPIIMAPEDVVWGLRFCPHDTGHVESRTPVHINVRTTEDLCYRF